MGPAASSRPPPETALARFGVRVLACVRCAPCQEPLNGGVSNGGASRSGLVLPFLSFFVLFGTFPIFLGFSRFARGWSGDFPD